MTRLLAMLIAVLLPLQLAWGMAAAYCQHEQVAAGGAHFGHHSHVHADGQPAGKQATSVGAQADLDCTSCHAAAPAVLPEGLAVSGRAPAFSHRMTTGDGRPPSAPQRAPDRPQWPRLA